MMMCQQTERQLYQAEDVAEGETLITGVSPPAAASTATPWLRYWLKWFLMLKFVHRVLCDVNVH